jgi:hypothetical protein
VRGDASSDCRQRSQLEEAEPGQCQVRTQEHEAEQESHGCDKRMRGSLGQRHYRLSAVRIVINAELGGRAPSPPILTTPEFRTRLRVPSGLASDWLLAPVLLAGSALSLLR